jgi:hypothetical protein
MALGSGSSNTATGAAALYWNTGDDNTALGRARCASTKRAAPTPSPDIVRCSTTERA